MKVKGHRFFFFLLHKVLSDEWEQKTTLTINNFIFKSLLILNFYLFIILKLYNRCVCHGGKKKQNKTKKQ